MEWEIQTLIALFGVLGSGFSAYLGVKVGMAEMRSDIKGLQDDRDAMDDRIKRLEDPYFRYAPTKHRGQS